MATRSLAVTIEIVLPVVHRAIPQAKGRSVWAARATGLPVTDWQNLITVNMPGQRFFDETEGNFTANNSDQIKDYRYGDYRNAKNLKYRPVNWVNAARAGIGDGHNGGGPIWAIFDSAAAAREGWSTEPPHVDRAAGFFFPPIRSPNSRRIS